MAETVNAGDTSCVEGVQIKQDKLRSCTGLLTSYHGIAYQLEWLMLVAMEAKSSETISGFTFRTEVDYEVAGKFDDVIWQYYCPADQKIKLNFLQAKHKLYENTEKITIKDLLKVTKEDNMFGLKKYYVSYRDSIKNNTKYENAIIENLFIATNIDLDEDLKNVFERLHTYNTILNISDDDEEDGRNPTCWKINNRLNEGSILGIIEILEDTYDLIKLAKKIDEIIFNHQEFVLPHDLQIYNKFIYTNVFNYDLNMINEDFIQNKNLSNETSFLREAFFNVAFIKKRKMLVMTENYEEISDTEEFAHFVANKIYKSSSKNKMARLVMTQKRRDNINKLANFVLIKKDGIKFNPNFWTKDDIDDNSLIIFRNQLILQLKSYDILHDTDSNVEISAKLDSYRFEIANFTTCKEHLVDEKSFWDIVSSYSSRLKKASCSNEDFIKLPNCSMNDIKDDINGFFDIFVIAVNYTKKRLSETVEEKLNKSFNWINNEFTAYAFRSAIANALDLTQEKFISTAEEVTQFFDKVEEYSNQLILLGPTLEYCAKLDTYNIKFRSTIITEYLYAFVKKLQDFSGFENSNEVDFKSLYSKQVFCVKTDEVLLSSIKIFHTLKDILECHNFEGKYIFMRLESITLLQDYVMQVFDKCANLLVMEYDVKDKENNIQNIYNKIKYILNSDMNKKVILITQGNNFFTRKLKSELKCKYFEVNDLEIDLLSLEKSTQLEVLKKGKIFFQGKELCISDLVNVSNNLIDPQILYHLLNHDKIEICSGFFDLDDVIKFYISRELICRKKISTDIIKDKSHDLFAFSKTEEIELNNIARRRYNSIFVDYSRRICKLDQIDFEYISNFKFFILGESSDVNEHNQLCEKFKEQNIHWLIKENDYFKWIHTKGKLTNLRHFLQIRRYYKENRDVGVNEIIEELISDRINIIAAVPGMGKSTFLVQLALKLKEIYPLIWVVFINLGKFRSQLKKININDEESAMDFLYAAAGFEVLQVNKEDYFRKRITKWLQKNEDIKNLSQELKIKGIDLLKIGIFKKKLHTCNEVYIFFDGFDEICPAFETRVTYLISVIKNLTLANVWITSRTYNTINKLEDNLATLSYSIKSFGEKEQSSFLVSYWKSCLNIAQFDTQRSKIFIDELLTEFSKVTNDAKRTFVGIPLQIKMLARNQLTMFQEFYESGVLKLNDEYKRKISKGLNLVRLYEEFIDIKFHEIRFKEKKHVWPTDDEDIEKFINNERHEFLREHQILALYTLYADFDDLFPDIKEAASNLLQKISNVEDKNAIIERVINKVPIFVHQTYAEYFSALYLWTKLKRITLEEFKSDFLKKMLYGSFFSDDRIQVCKFFCSIADKEIKENIELNFSHTKDKITFILDELLPIIQAIYISYESTRSVNGTDDLKKIIVTANEITSTFERNPNFVQMVKNIFFIVESYLKISKSENLGIINIIESDKYMTLLQMASETGCLSVVKTFCIKNIYNYENILSNSKWHYNPLWLAAKNGYLDVLKHLSFAINPNWTDGDCNTFFQHAYNRSELNVIRSCLTVNVFDGNPFLDTNGLRILPLVYAMECFWPFDIIQILIEKTDICVFDNFLARKNLKASFVISIALLKYEFSLTKLVVDKGFNFFGVINILLFEFHHASFHGPIEDIMWNDLSLKYGRPSFHSEQEFLMLPKLVEYFLSSGIGYNNRDIHGEYTIRYAKKNYYICKLLSTLLCNYKLSNISPRKLLLKCIIDFAEDTKITNNSGNLFMSFNTTDNTSDKMLNSYLFSLKKYDYETYIRVAYTQLKLIPSSRKFIFDYLEQSTEVINRCLDNFYFYLDTAKIEIAEFKNYSDCKLYNRILTGYEEMLEYRYRGDTSKKTMFKSLTNFEKEILKWILNLYIKQDYAIDEAVNEVIQNIWRYKKLRTWIESRLGSCNIPFTEIIDILDLHCVDTSQSELKNQMNKITRGIIECGGLTELLEIWDKLSYIGDKRLVQVIETMLKYEQVSTSIFELINGLHKSYKKLTEAIETKRNQNVNDVVKSINNGFIKAVVNGQDAEYGSPLHYAVFIGHTEAVKLLLKHGADPHQRLECNSLLIGDDCEGFTALQISEREEHHDITQLLQA